ILSQPNEVRRPSLAALREIYDGSWTRYVGAGGGKALSWSGKLGVIAGCTPVIDNHHAVVGAMGERFIFYRLPATEEKSLAEKALGNVGREATMREEIASVVKRLFLGIDFHEKPLTLSDDEKAALIDLAQLAARCRSAVERDGYRREIELIP